MLPIPPKKREPGFTPLIGLVKLGFAKDGPPSRSAFKFPQGGERGKGCEPWGWRQLPKKGASNLTSLFLNLSFQKLEGISSNKKHLEEIFCRQITKLRLFEDHEIQIHISVSYPKRTCSPEPRIWNLYLAKFVFRNKKPSWPGLGKYNYTVPAQALPFIQDFKEPMSEPLPLLPKAYWSTRGSACARWGNSNVERLFRVLRTAIPDACHVECHHFVSSRLRKTFPMESTN